MVVSTKVHVPEPQLLNNDTRIWVLSYEGLPNVPDNFKLIFYPIVPIPNVYKDDLPKVLFVHLCGVQSHLINRQDQLLLPLISLDDAWITLL